MYSCGGELHVCILRYVTRIIKNRYTYPYTYITGVVYNIWYLSCSTHLTVRTQIQRTGKQHL